MNERITEDIIRTHFKSFKGWHVEEQSSQNQAIADLLKSATKKGTGKNLGRPEFVITFNDLKETICVIEAKADTKKHESQSPPDDPINFAVDGVLHYAQKLSAEFNVLAIAVSGKNKENIKVSHYFHLKGGENKEVLPAGKLLDQESYEQAILAEVKQQDLDKIFDYYRALNNKLHDYKIKEDARALLVSCILIALRVQKFQDDYPKYKQPKDLLEFLLESAKEGFKDVREISVIEDNFVFIKNEKKLVEENILLNLIDEVKNQIHEYVRTHKFYDALSELYIEFLRYSNSDKSLGIVLTPRHIADLAVELASVNKKSVAIDTCCGTGTFLVSAMKKMIEDASGDAKLEEDIKKNSVLGIEYAAHLYSLACSNMFIHGDGKSNILHDDCFEDNEHKDRADITVGLLNPPFDSKDSKDEEFKYLLENLKYLQPKGICVCVLPKKCTLTTPKMVEYRKQLIREHTILAILSLPLDLFHNSKVSVATTIFVVQAHQPQDTRKIWLSFCDDDGFEITKNKGREDMSGKWPSIKKRWVESFHDRRETDGFSVMKKLEPQEEFCAEAYIATDYSSLNQNYFERILKLHLAYRLIEDKSLKVNANPVIDKTIKLDWEKWEERKYEDIFEKIERGKFGSSPDLLDKESNVEERTILIGASQNHNGSNYEYVIDPPAYDGNYITVGNGGNTGCGQAFYQSVPFNAKSTVNLLRLKNKRTNAFNALFLVGLIRLERFRYNFGRGWGLESMANSKIRLPVTSDGEVDYDFMENYIKSLSYSKSLEV